MGLNKGEWSEIYVFLKLLADGNLYAADANLNKIQDSFYPIIKILRKEPSGSLEFARGSNIEVLDGNGKKLLELEIELFKHKAIELLDRIKKSFSRSFEVPEIVDFLESIQITKLKAKSSEKRDITLVVHDSKTGLKPTLGFSIKSKLGGASTLINASGSTNFVFEVKPPLSPEEVQRVNSIASRSKIKDRIEEIEKVGSRLVYSTTQSLNFKQNLTMIDSMFPQIIAETLLFYYKGEATSVRNLLTKISKSNPCKFDLSQDHPFYEYKFKGFLVDSALGMTPASTWKGKLDASGGYIIVKEDGELACYHLYNANEFQNYLFNNTKLETPSSSKHGFGNIYTEGGNQFIKLNLQVRFQ